MPTLPALSTISRVVVANEATEESWNSGAVPLFAPATSRRARGDDVPIPVFPWTINPSIGADSV